MRTPVPHSDCPPCFHMKLVNQDTRTEDLGIQLLVIYCSAETEGRSPPAAEPGKSLVFTLGNSKSWELHLQTEDESSFGATYMPVDSRKRIPRISHL